VLLRLPAVLKLVIGRDRLHVRGTTLPEAIEDAFEQVPLLRHHLTLKSGGLRPHILCLLNGESVPRDQIEATALSEGDEILIHQAISGG
jgi:sulfur carrier protein ThiS